MWATCLLLENTRSQARLRVFALELVPLQDFICRFNTSARWKFPDISCIGVVVGMYGNWCGDVLKFLPSYVLGYGASSLCEPAIRELLAHKSTSLMEGMVPFSHMKSVIKLYVASIRIVTLWIWHLMCMALEGAELPVSMWANAAIEGGWQQPAMRNQKPLLEIGACIKEQNRRYEIVLKYSKLWSLGPFCVQIEFSLKATRKKSPAQYAFQFPFSWWLQTVAVKYWSCVHSDWRLKTMVRSNYRFRMLLGFIVSRLPSVKGQYGDSER